MTKQTKIPVLVKMFGDTLTVPCTIYGEKLDLYEKDSILWIERGEEWYALDHYIRKNKPFCILQREDFLMARADL